MRNLKSSALGIIVSGTVAMTVSAQQLEDPQSLPDAKPGECYAKVVTPAVFSTRTEEVVIQEASERIETVEAVYEDARQSVEIREETQALQASDAVFRQESTRVEISPAETTWVSTTAAGELPASPDALQVISDSGIDLDAVQPGSCYTEYFTEAQYRTITEQVLVKEASQRIVITPARFETVQETVLVKEASSRVVDVPAVYRAESESVLVEPARSVWQSDCGLVEQVDNTTGEILCLVEVPARYETLTKTVLESAPTTRTETIPAEYVTVDVERIVEPASEQRIDVPAEYTTVSRREKVSDPVFFWLAKGEEADANARPTGREICLKQRPAEYETVVQALVETEASSDSQVIPARFESVAVQRLVTPASEQRIVIPARTRTVTTREETEPARMEWRRVLCQANMSKDIISTLQQALKREGYDPGPIDGIFGRSTSEAIERYQRDEGIDQRGITFEVLQRLKVQS